MGMDEFLDVSQMWDCILQLHQTWDLFWSPGTAVHLILALVALLLCISSVCERAEV